MTRRITSISTLRECLEQNLEQKEEYALEIKNESYLEKYLSEEDMSLIVEAIQNVNCNITSLSLIACRLRLEAVQALANALENQDYRVKSLCLDRTYIGHEGLLKLPSVLGKLESLTLDWNILGPRDAEMLCYLLKNQDCRVKSLSVAGNNFGYEGVQILSPALGKLESFNVSRNNIGLNGAQILARVLENRNGRLKSLNVSHNCLSLNGAQALFDVFKEKSCGLRLIDVSENDLGPLEQQFNEIIQEKYCQDCHEEITQVFEGASPELVDIIIGFATGYRKHGLFRDPQPSNPFAGESPAQSQPAAPGALNS